MRQLIGNRVDMSTKPDDFPQAQFADRVLKNRFLVAIPNEVKSDINPAAGYLTDNFDDFRDVLPCVKRPTCKTLLLSLSRKSGSSAGPSTGLLITCVLSGASNLAQ